MQYFEINVLLAIAVSFVAALIAGFIIIPLLRKAKAGQYVRDDGPQSHLKKAGTPTMGGVIMLVGIIIATLVFSMMNEFVLLCIIPMVAFTFIGFFDDYIKLFKKRSLGLRAYQKIILQLAFAIATAVCSYYYLGSEQVIPFTDITFDMGWGYIPFTTVVIIAVVNSVNLTDGLDGLASGVTMIDAVTFMLIFAGMFFGNNALSIVDTNSYNGMIFCGAVAAACGAFLVFNHYPAKVFMGDTGAFALGGAVAMMGILSKMQLVLPIIGLMYVLSSVSVILQVGSYKLRKKRIFRMAPLHHHFELGGMHETKVVAMYMSITGAICAAYLLITYFV